MRGAFNALSHRLGFDLRAWPPISETATNLARILNHIEIDVVFDIGANVGQFALAIRRAGYVKKIVSFEPGAAAYRRLVVAADGDGKWQVGERTALGDSDGTAILNTFNRSDMNSLAELRPIGKRAFPKLEPAGEERVSIRRLDKIFGDYVADSERVFVKLDTQGTEGSIIRGSEGVIDRIAGIQTELPIVGLYERGDGMFDLVDHITRLGFELIMITPVSFSKRLNRQLEVDAVFARDL